MTVSIPELCLVVLVGPSGSGKSTFARQHFKASEVLSSDYCRALVCDDESDQSATRDAFDVLHYIARKRLSAGRLTVIDATSVQAEARKSLLELAREYHVLPVAIAFDLPEKLCEERNRHRPERVISSFALSRQCRDLRRSLSQLEREGFRHVTIFRGPDEVDTAEVERRPLWNNRRHMRGPFDIIGDVHGCLPELLRLLTELGYQVGEDAAGWAVTPPAGRTAIFVGDLVDRGPDVPGVLRLVMGMVKNGTAMCVPGNHDVKLVKALQGRKVERKHGLAESLQQLELESPEFRNEVASFLDGLVSHYVFDEGRLVVAHAGLPEAMHGRTSGRVREFCLFGETTGETDEFGLPVRYNWAADYRGRAMVVYGHTPVPQPEWLNNTINIDTGGVFGGRLSALRYPERELVSVAAERVYQSPVRPLGQGVQPVSSLNAQQLNDDLLDLQDLMGRRRVETSLGTAVTLPEENVMAAIEATSRFGADPRWLIYLPPTMSPAETSQHPGLLEHPAEAFGYYRRSEVAQVVCEQKHMGSRAVVIVCRDEEAARRRFGVLDGDGICYTRTGRRFFDDGDIEKELLARLRSALERSRLWEELATDWVCLDAELMPWSVKAQELVRRQYAALSSAARPAMRESIRELERAGVRQDDLGEVLERFRQRSQRVQRYREAWRRYCWPVHSLADIRLAPFHLLASEGGVHSDRDHTWHMQTLVRLAEADPELILATPYRVVDLTDPDAVTAAILWWEALTASGGEGMVVKPLSFVVRQGRSLVQPAVKCRGAEYLRIIYGPEYDAPQNLERLRQRAVSAKRALAVKEFALGMESLQRFAAGEPLRRIHECAIGVLALESEPIDPRL